MKLDIEEGTVRRSLQKANGDRDQRLPLPLVTNVGARWHSVSNRQRLRKKLMSRQRGEVKGKACVKTCGKEVRTLYSWLGDRDVDLASRSVQSMFRKTVLVAMSSLETKTRVLMHLQCQGQWYVDLVAIPCILLLTVLSPQLPSNSPTITLEDHNANMGPCAGTSTQDPIDLSISDSEYVGSPGLGPSNSPNVDTPGLVLPYSSGPFDVETEPTNGTLQKQQSVYGFLSTLGLEHLHSVFRDHGYTHPDDVTLFCGSSRATREAVLEELKKDDKILLRDWNVLHAALQKE